MNAVLFNINPLPTWIYEYPTLKILEANNSAINFFEYTNEEFIKLKLNDLMPRNELERFKKLFSKGIPKDDNCLFGIYTHKKKNGEHIKLEVRGQGINYHEKESILVVCQDVTEKINAETISLQNEERMNLFVQGSFDLLGIIDKEGYYTYLSPSSTTINGIDPKDFIGQYAFDYIHTEDAERVLESLRKVYTTGIEIIKPFRAKNNKNEWRWVETSLTNKLNNPQVKGIVINSRDITSQIEEKQKSKLLESVITQTKDAVLITEAEPFDEPGPRIVYVNKAFTKMTGYEAEEVIGKTPRILQGPKSDFKELAKLSRAIRNWESYEITTINYKKNGEEFWINFTVSPVADENGWYTHWIAIERDVTESKLAEERLIKAKEIAEDNELKMKEAQKLAQLGSWYYDVVNQVSQWSDETYNIWGLNPDSTTVKFVDHEKLVNPKDWERFNAVIENAKAKGISYKMELEILRPDGTFKTVNTIGAPIFDENNKVIAFKGTTQDISERIKIENELRRAKENAEKNQNAMTQASNLAKIGYWDHDFATNTLKCSDYIYQLYDLTPNEDILSYEEFKNYFDRPSQEKLSKVTKELFENGASYDLELRMISSKNEEIYIRNVAHPVYSDQNEIIGASGVIQNITEGKYLQELNREVARMVKIGSWNIDLEEQKVFWSEEVHEIHETDSKYYVPNLAEGINFYREDFQAMVRLNVEKAIANGESWDFEAVIVTAKKNEKWIRSIGNTESIDGKCVRIYGGLQDINMRKQSENRLLNLSLNLPGIVYEYHIYPDGTDALKNISGKVEEIWGYKAEELMENMNLAWAQIEAGGKIDEVRSSIQQSIETKSKWQCQIKYVMPTTGKLHTHVGFGTPTFLSDGTIVFNSIILDITNEAKNEDLLEQTTRIARIGSWEMDLLNSSGENMYWSPMIKEILEIDESYKPSLAMGIEFHIGESRDRIKKALELLINNGEEFDEEILLKTAKGKERWVRAIGKSELINNKRTRIYGSYQDIHEKKIATLGLETSLKELQDYKFSLDQSAIIAVTDKKGVITSVNDNFCRISGYSREELLGQTHQLVNSNYHSKQFFADLWKTIGSGEVFRSEIKNKAKDGSYYWVDTTIVPFLDEKNKPKQYLAIRFDITNRKNAESNLIAISDRLRLATTSAKMGIWEWDIINDTLTWDDRMYELYGVKKEDFNGAVSAWQNGLHPDDVERASKELNDALAGKGDFNSIFRVIWPDNSIHYIEGNAIVAKDSNGKAVRMIGSNTDITDRKYVEDELIKSEQKYRKLAGQLKLQQIHLTNAQEVAKIGSWETEFPSLRVKWSDETFRIFGIDSNHFKPTHEKFLQFVHHLDRDKLNKAFLDSTLSADQLNHSIEHRIITATGEEKVVEERWKVTFNSKGKPIVAIGSCQDITERKHKEEELFKSNERFEKVTEATNDAIWDWDILNNKLYRSPAIERFFGKKAPKLLASSAFWEDSFHPDDIVKIKNSLNEALANPLTTRWKLEYRVFNQSSKLLYVIDQGVIVRNEKGEAIRMVGAMTDITEQKIAEKENRFKANLLKTVGQAAIATNLEGIVNYWNKAAETIYGWSAEEAIGKNVNILTPSDVDEEQVKEILTQLKSGQTWSGEFIVQKKDGTKFPIRVSNSPVYDENSNLSGMIGISSDITKEVENQRLIKKYTNQLERSNQKLRKIAWTQSHVVRAPLSRILGIINLIEMEENNIEDLLSWIKQLKISTQEMDLIVKKIVSEANHLEL